MKREVSMNAKNRTSKTKRIVSGYLQTLAIILGTAVAVIAISTANSGGTYALMSSSLTVPAGSINSGSSSLTIQDVPAYTITSMNVSQLLPGRTTITPQPLIIKNTGTTPLSVVVGTTTFSSGITALTSKLQFSVRQAATCSITPDGQAFPASTATITLAVGQSVPVCVEVGLKADADSSVQGQSATFTIPLNATQVRP